MKIFGNIRPNNWLDEWAILLTDNSFKMFDGSWTDGNVRRRRRPHDSFTSRTDATVKREKQLMCWQIWLKTNK